MNRLILTILIAFFGLDIMAGVPTWTVNPSDFSNSMVMAGVINNGGVESRDENDLIAAFVDGEVRGVANVQYEAAIDRYIAYLIIYNNTSSSVVTFKVYDSANDLEIDAQNSASFVINGALGNPGSPYVWSDIVLNMAANMLSFTFPEAIGPETIGTGDIQVPVETNATLSALTATFTTSVGASAYVNNVLQVSGQTINDFSSPLVYDVISEDGENLSSFTVSATTINNSPTGLHLTVSAIDENNAVNAVVGSLTVTDDDLTHTYALEAGSGDTDNTSFEIVGTEVRANESFDFENKNDYSIRVKVIDGAGQILEKSFSIKVLNINEAPQDILLNNKSIKENVEGGGILGVLSAIDIDDAEEFSYSLPTSIEDNNLFKLTAGNLLASTQAFDYETKSSYTISVLVTDKGGLTMAKTFDVEVLDQEETVTAVDEMVRVQLHVYPNPVQQILTIKNYTGKTTDISVIDSFGRRQLVEVGTNMKVDMSMLPNGVYFVKVIDKGVHFLRLIKN